MSRDFRKRLADAGLVALRCEHDEWPRSLLSEGPVPEDWMALVEGGDGRRRLVRGGTAPRFERGERLLLVRNRAVTVSLDVPETMARDGLPIAGVCEVLVGWEANENELVALSRTVMEGAELTLERLAKLVVQSGMGAAVAKFVRERDAGDLTSKELRQELLAFLRGEMKRFLFESGLVFERIGRLEFKSRALAEREYLRRETEQRLERVKSRDVVEQAALAATRRRLDDLAGLLEKMKGAARPTATADGTTSASSGAVANPPVEGRWHELLPALTPAERGRLLENLWRITPDRQKAVAVVLAAGSEVVWIDPCEPERITRRVVLPPDLGGLRSLVHYAAKNWLLVGAATGVWVIDAETGGVVEKYSVPDAGNPKTGFNAAAISGDRLCATHSQLGCWSWPVGRPGEAVAVLRPANGVPRTIRAVKAGTAGQIVFAADDAVHVFGADGGWAPELHAPGITGAATAGIGAAVVGERNAGANASPVSPMNSIDVSVAASMRSISTGSSSRATLINSLDVLDREIYVGTSQGQVLHCDLDSPAGGWQTLYRGSEPIESICARRWNDLVELVIPAGMQGVIGVYGAEGVVTRLLETTTAIRRVWVCDDAVVALNEHRDRLIVMNSNMPERTGREVPIARMLGRSIQDVCIVTSREAAAV